MMTGASKAVKRSHMIVELLAGRYFDGLSNKELAGLLKVSAANISRDLSQLADLGYARKLENGRWGLTTRPLAVMQSYITHYNNIEARMKETGRNIASAALRQEL
jgi:DNA-binding IclR family transcriptional regulator